MKIAYIDYYENGQSEHKDPISIPHALFAEGHQLALFNCNPRIKEEVRVASYKILPLAIVDKAEWKNFHFDLVIFASRLWHQHTAIISVIRESGLRLIIKADTDGTWGYPLAPNYLRARPIGFNLFNLARHLKWRVPSNFLVKRKLEQLQLSDKVIVESPGAAINAARVLQHWEMNDQVRKISFIPNPVSAVALSLPLCTEKQDVLVCAGRWEDRGVKNTVVMLHVIKNFLQSNKEYRVELVGSGLNNDEVMQILGQDMLSTRVSLFPELPYLDLQKKMGAAKIVLVPSTLESFCFVAAEALCAGASIVVTPVESLQYLAGGGKWGSIARGFGVKDISSALAYEVEAWKSGLRDSTELALVWRFELNPAKIAQRILKLID